MIMMRTRVGMVRIRTVGMSMMRGKHTVRMKKEAITAIQGGVLGGHTYIYICIYTNVCKYVARGGGGTITIQWPIYSVCK